MFIIDDAENHQLVTRRHLRNIEKEVDLTKSTGVVSAKYPPKVKLENSS